MCNPVIPAVIGTGLNLVGGAMQDDDSGDAAREEAERLRARGRREAKLVRQANERAVSRQRVAMLRGGVTGSGSPTDALLDLAQEGARDAYWAERNYEDAAREKERAARRARRRGVLDQLTHVNSLGGNVIDLYKSGDLQKWP